MMRCTFHSNICKAWAAGKVSINKYFCGISAKNPSYSLFSLSALVIHGVHVHGEGDVLHHHEDVRHGDPCQDEIDWVIPHVLMAQHDDV